MKQRGVGEHAVEIAIRKIELEKILFHYFTAGVGARHGGKRRRALQAGRGVTKLGKYLQIAPWPAAEIQYPERRLALDVLQQGCDVLGDVVVARAFPEIFRMPVIVIQRETRDV